MAFLVVDGLPVDGLESGEPCFHFGLLAEVFQGKNWASREEAASPCWPRAVASWRRMVSSYRPIAEVGSPAFRDLSAS
jgi:hypothetical protein